MKNKINVLVIEDNEYYGNLLANAIQNSINPFLERGDFQLVIHTFTNAAEYIRKVESGKIKCDYNAVFIDYFLGEGISADDVINTLKKQSCNAMIVLMSHSKDVKEKYDFINYNYFVVKDRFAPSLCGLYLQQYIEDKYSVSLDQ
ncbi:MAG TPA: hypothetical protein PLX08_09355 [Bacteroidales bacterium]|jgi:DNA-binding NtrC family response regulator|nr:hypothetical protein [Bacteroidales bacterium]